MDEAVDGMRSCRGRGATPLVIANRTTALMIHFRPTERSGVALARFERGDARLQPLVLFSRLFGHGFYSLEFFATDDIHVRENTIGLAAHDRFDFLAQALGGAGGVGHHFCKFVKQTVAGLCHDGCCPLLKAARGRWPLHGVGFKIGHCRGSREMPGHAPCGAMPPRTGP